MLPVLCEHFPSTIVFVLLNQLRLGVVPLEILMGEIMNGTTLNAFSAQLADLVLYYYGTRLAAILQSRSAIKYLNE